MVGKLGPNTHFGLNFWTATVSPSIPTPDQTKIFRGHLRSLPDQPAQQPALSWTWRYSLTLIGKDQFPTGEQVADLAPGQRPPEQVQLHAWQWSYNLNLISQDRLPAGKQVSDLAPRGPEFSLLLRDPQWSRNINLFPPPVITVGVTLRPPLKGLPEQPPRLLQWQQPYNVALYKPTVAALPVGEQSSDLAPRSTVFDGQLRGWVWNYNLNLVGKDRLPIGKNVSDLTPRAYEYHVQLRSWQWAYNLNLIGQDRLPIGAVVSDLPPRAYQQPALSWLNTFIPASVINPPIVFDTGTPQAAQQAAQTWTASYNQSLIGKDRLPFRQTDWPIAPTPPWYREWAQNLLQTTLRPVVAYPLTAFNQYDWPVPRGYQQPAQSWTWSYNQNLISQDKLPVGEVVTDRPALLAPAAFQTWINAVNLSLVTAPPNLYALARQQDWPNPVQPPRRDQTWTFSYNLDLIGQDRLPVGQISVALPAQAPAPTQTWLNTFIPAPAPKPFAQYDWPLPTPAPAPGLTTAASYNKNLVGQDQLPFRQGDWPVPRAAAFVVRDWIASTNIALLAPAAAGPLGLVFNNYDWPLTPAAAQPDRFVGAAYNKNLIGQDRLPSNQKDWPFPNLGPAQPDRSFGFFNPNLYPPTPPPPPLIVTRNLPFFATMGQLRNR